MINQQDFNAGSAVTPEFVLKIDDRNITKIISDRLLNLTMTDHRGFEADELSLTLDDSDGALELPSRGARIELWLGWKGKKLEEKGAFTVDEIRHSGEPDTLFIKGRSADLRGSLNTQRDASYHDTTLGALVTLIAARNQLEAGVSPALKDIKIAHIDQSQESDVNFLTRLAERNGAEISVKMNKVLFLHAGRGMTISGNPIPKVVIGRDMGNSHNFSLTDRNNYTGVTARWLETKQPDAQAQSVTLQRKKKDAAPQAAPHPLAKTAVKPEDKGEPYMVGDPDNSCMLSTVFASKEQAIRAAQAKWETLQRGVSKLTFTLALGNETLYPETPVTLRGFKREIDNETWTITKLTHVMDNQGFITRLDLEVLLKDVEYEESNSKQ